MKRADATAALSWANNTRATADTRITATEFRVLCVIAGGCNTRATIAAAAGCGESTIPRAVRKLVKIGALRVTPEKGKANAYEIQVRSDTGVTADTGIKNENTGITARRTPTKSDTGAAVDNASAYKKHAGARGEDNLLTLELELNPEPVETSATTLAHAPIKLLNGSAKTMHGYQLSEKLIEFVDSPWLNPRSDGLGRTCPLIRQWIDDGADFDKDVVPTVRELCERKGEPITTYKYFTAAVRRAAQTRLTIERQAPNPITANEATNDQPSRPSVDGVRVRREPVSPATAARMQRRAAREAQHSPIEYGRVASVRVE